MHERNGAAADDRRDRRANQHVLAVLGEETVYRPQLPEADFLCFFRGVQQAQERRQKRDAENVSDDHAGAGDATQLCESRVVRRQERIEGQRGGNGGKGEPRSGARTGMRQRLLEPTEAVSLGAIAHAELYAKIHPQTHEQHDERDGDHVETGVDQQTDGGGDGQPDNDGSEDREDHPHRAQRQPQHDQRGPEHQAHEQCPTIGDAGEFFIGHRHGAGDPHIHAVFRPKA